MTVTTRLVLPLVLGLAVGCGAPAGEGGEQEQPGPELGLGEVDDLGVKEDGWGAALDCKPIPSLPPLRDPEIVVSIDGLTLHLRDRAGGYDRVFPVGVGTIDSKGASLTVTSTGLPTGTFFTGTDTREVRDAGWGWFYPCRIWWTDSETGVKKPVFAGLPFIRLQGPPTSAYALHGPVDAFSRPDGGLLRRGYVSHGCVRMASADIVEVYARIRGKAKTPVRIQKEVERDLFSRALDVPDRWIGQECETDADCNYEGGTCRRNPYGHGYCSRSCTRGCPDRQGYNVSRCVSDEAGGGMCVISADKVNNSCKGLHGRVARSMRLLGSTASATVCVPGTPGGVGDPCLTGSECGSGGICEPSGVAGGPGFCSLRCTATCPGTSVCTRLETGSRCVETCWGQDVCAPGLACTDGVVRTAGGVRRACVP
jgi:hypothetical protein